MGEDLARAHQPGWAVLREGATASEGTAVVVVDCEVDGGLPGGGVAHYHPRRDSSRLPLLGATAWACFTARASRCSGDMVFVDFMRRFSDLHNKGGGGGGR